jgi:hypothetical protein
MIATGFGYRRGEVLPFRLAATGQDSAMGEDAAMGDELFPNSHVAMDGKLSPNLRPYAVSQLVLGGMCHPWTPAAQRLTKVLMTRWKLRDEEFMVVKETWVPRGDWLFPWRNAAR